MSLFNRAKIIDQNFTLFVESEKFPKPDSNLSLNGVSISDLVSLFESQVFSRHLDLKARTMKEEGKCFYTIASSGHEKIPKAFNMDSPSLLVKTIESFPTKPIKRASPFLKFTFY